MSYNSQMDRKSSVWGDKMKTIRVRIEADIEVSENFDIQELAIGKYGTDLIDDDTILLKDDDFRVIDYHEIIEIGENR